MKRRSFLRTVGLGAVAAPALPAIVARFTAPAQQATAPAHQFTARIAVDAGQALHELQALSGRLAQLAPWQPATRRLAEIDMYVKGGRYSHPGAPALPKVGDALTVKEETFGRLVGVVREVAFRVTATREIPVARVLIEVDEALMKAARRAPLDVTNVAKLVDSWMVP